jgi:hypothetical protein
MSMVGYFVRPLEWSKRGVLLLAGFGLLIPPGGVIAFSWAINAVAAVVCLAIGAYEWRRREPAAAELSAVTP